MPCHDTCTTSRSVQIKIAGNLRCADSRAHLELVHQYRYNEILLHYVLHNIAVRLHHLSARMPGCEQGSDLSRTRALV